VRQRDDDDPERQWGYVFAIARTWKTVDLDVARKRDGMP